ncbi:MAG: hypothetical protein FIB01_04635 [Gemmatimonadetes bacterium]|nr:hypothetical protein [Gemmatimonadota bacterium]
MTARPSRRRRRPGLAPALLLALLAAAPARAQQTHLLVVSGLSGEPRFAADFESWTRQLTTTAVQAGVPAANIGTLSEQAPGARQSTRANVLGAVQALAARAGGADEVLIVLFGHGSESGGEARLNLTGPDLTARDLAAALAAVRARRITIVNTASASGAFLKPLAGPNRIVITATKSGAEQNETMFPRFFVAGLTGAAADTDKDGRVSFLEAFDYARQETERAYTSTRRLQTEHPLLEADGDGVGVPAPSAREGDGAVAALAVLGAPALPAGAPAAAGEELRALQAEKQRIEAALADLRGQQARLPAAEYQQRLEQLLLDLSRNGQAIRRLTGGGS